MGYEKWYSTTSSESSHHSILEFFGFRLTVKQAEHLKALKSTNYKKIDEKLLDRQRRK